MKATTSTLIIVSLLISFNSKAQKTYKGQFVTSPTAYSEITYTREYKELDSNRYVTIYRIFSKANGHYLNITATHFKLEKRIEVSVDDITVPSTFGHLSTQEYTYEEPSDDWFGVKGSFKASFDPQNRLPNQLALKFVSTKFENVKVVHISKDTGMNSTKWYVLDEDS